MSTTSIFQIAGSALTAQSQRLNTTASNLANADTAATPGSQAYRARQVVFQLDPAVTDKGRSVVGGVRVAGVVESTAPGRLQYEPGHPLANADGDIEMPNVDVVAETVNMISASRAYQANVEVINTTKSLMARTLTIGQ